MVKDGKQQEGFKASLSCGKKIIRNNPEASDMAITLSVSHPHVSGSLRGTLLGSLLVLHPLTFPLFGSADLVAPGHPRVHWVTQTSTSITLVSFETTESC